MTVIIRNPGTRKEKEFHRYRVTYVFARFKDSGPMDKGVEIEATEDPSQIKSRLASALRGKTGMACIVKSFNRN